MDVDIKTRKVLLTREQIEKRAAELGAQICEDLRVNPFI